jgi:hypothetical protein
MPLQIVGAGLPRTSTTSLREALERLLGGRCYHMQVIPDHPFNLGEAWDTALAGGTPDWDQVFDGFKAAVDWPASAFWRELSAKYPDATVILSVRDSAQTWYDSISATILPVAREALVPDWSHGRGLLTLFERFTGTTEWDDPALLMASYDRHNDEVRAAIPASRLLEWRATDGWEPLCRVLGVPVPDVPFPHMNRRTEWG